jgi:transcriptional regulator GlxA family with amidase domain
LILPARLKYSPLQKNNEKLFDVFTIGETGQPIRARNGLKVVPDVSFKSEISFDILIIPGGYGAEEIEINNKNVLEWIKTNSGKVDILASIYTGAFLLAKCGLLDGKKATTHWMDIDRLVNEYPRIQVIRNKKFVDEGNIITSGGISAGINMSFHIISRIFGNEVAKATAKRMEYDIEIS